MGRVWFTIAALASKGFIVGRGIMSSSGRSSSSVRDLVEKLKSNQGNILLLDGGTGEELFQRGVPDDRKIWSASALVHEKYHSILADVHRSFLDAGADAITTNSYGVVPGVGFTTDEINKHVATAGRIARQVVDNFHNDNRPKKKLVLGSLGPLLESYRPDKLLEAQEGIQMYGIITRALLPYVDVFIAETMSCVEEASQAIQAVGQLIAEQNIESSCRTMIVSYTLDLHGRLRNGESATSAVTRTVDLCNAHQVELLAVLFNCALPESITQALKGIREDSALQRTMNEQAVMTGAYANRLTPVDPDWSMGESDAPQPTRDDLSIERYSNEFVYSWVKDLGASIVGGCCGITPEYIADIHKTLRTS